MSFTPGKSESATSGWRGRSAALLLLWGLLGGGFFPVQAAIDSLLKVEQGGSVVILGNGTAEGMQQHGYLESAIHCAYPQSELRVRNLGWTGDEVGRMLREPGFGDLDSQLELTQADVIVCFFGLNESFQGSSGLEPFQSDLRTFIQERLRQFYNGHSKPQLVFISPVPYQQVLPDMPAAEPLNAELRLYTGAMRDVCVEEGVIFFDVFGSMEAAITESGRLITDNGVQLNAYGYWLLSKLVAAKLGLIDHNSPVDPISAAKLRDLILTKNQHWLQRWRPVNGQYVYGAAREPFGGASFPGEMNERSRIVASADGAIWKHPKPGIMSVWAREPEPGSGYQPPEGPLPIEEPSSINADDYRSPEESLLAFRLGSDLEVSLWASEEDLPLANPTAMRFDSQGRLWVTCSPSWPHPKPGAVPDDYLAILEDVDLDHRVDRHRIFARGLFLPTGFVLTKEGALVTEQRALVHYRDMDEDGVADARSEVFAGFGTGDCRDSIRGLDWEPGGDMWFCQGARAFSRVETAWGPRHIDGAAMLQLDPFRLKLETTQLAGMNRPKDRVLDQWGTALITDGGQGRVYERSQVLGLNAAQADLALGWDAHQDIWDGELLFSRHFARDLRSVYLQSQVEEFQGIRGYERLPAGSGFYLKARAERFLKSTDPSFRPVAMEIGPDGALYVLDAYNPLMDLDASTMQDPRRAHSHGRVWRVTSHGKRPFWRLPTHKVPTAELLGRFLEEEPSTRKLARWELWQRDPDEVLAEVPLWLEEGLPSDHPRTQQALTELLWLRQAYRKPDAELLDQLSLSPSPGARAVAARVLGAWNEKLDQDKAYELLTRLVEDEDPRVRLASLNAAEHFGTGQAGDIARLARHHTMDPSLQLVYRRVTEALGTENGSPASERAKALAKGSQDLVNGEMTSHAASVLMGRDGVEMSGLIRAATVLARRQDQSLAAYLLDCLTDPTTPNAVLRNVVDLLPKADEWELHFASPRLQHLAQRQANPIVREGAYVGLLIAAAASDTFDERIASVAAMGELELVALLEAAETAMGQDAVKSRLKTVALEELSRVKDGKGIPARFIQVIAPRSLELRFTELEALVGEKNVALNQTATQFIHPESVPWWVNNANAGVNGTSNPEEEPEFLDTTNLEETPIRGVAVGGPTSGELDLWWGVDLGKGEVQPVEKLVLHPPAGGFTTPWLRFELRGPLGSLVWRGEVPTTGEKPLEVEVDLHSRRLVAARKIANKLGDDFEKSLLAKAEHSSSMDTRFQAMRALASLNAAPSHLRISQVQLAAGSGSEYVPAQIAVKPKQPVEMHFHNRNGHAMNLVVLEPGTEIAADLEVEGALNPPAKPRPASSSKKGPLNLAEAGILPLAEGDQSGVAGAASSQDAEGKKSDSELEEAETEEEVEEEEPPPPPKVLRESPVVESGSSIVFRFIAPEEPGEYPIRSSASEKWQKLQGSLRVR